MRPVRNGVSIPGDRKRGLNNDEAYMTTTEEMKVTNYRAGQRNGNETKAYPLFLAKQADSKTLPLHLEKQGKIDNSYHGPVKRIRFQRKDHESTYDLSVNPKNARIN